MRTRMCVLTAGVLLALTACSSGGSDAPADSTTGSGESGAATETTEIQMGVLPIVPSAALQLGIDEGIFADHGFDVSLETGQGGAALLPAVMSGQLQFAISNPLSIMLAQEQGLDIRMVTGYSHSNAEGDDVTSVWAKADSGIASPADLAGKTVAVNTLKTMGEISIKEIVSKAGGDPDSINFVELGFPDMPAALESGNIDAAWVPEPFQTIFKDSGANLVAYNYQETMPGVPTMSVITAGPLAESDPDMVQEFVAAVDEVTTFAEDNPDKVRATLTTFLDMDEALANKVLVEHFGAQMNEDSLQALSDLSVKYGLLQNPVDMATFMP
ncbi:ABC transporter substrate-binding protein [Georgenia yuyongxinii]|uniref:PhnD/SsuA/transferrin family substrate-binding protein n=1 Tax=Georgenia yuyongxinii TaxID=2589797 RepID=A0A552WPJ2_9MICO|nr:ABC transporter substrate-binding protein [Georgenia yuyongxinii]TRW44680.1 PhnD/SsuA/transferrin family substrate-binding protein [Georgenia yuyongxinii]